MVHLTKVVVEQKGKSNTWTLSVHAPDSFGILAGLFGPIWPVKK